MVLIVLIVAVVIFNRTYNKKSPIPEKANSQTVPLSEILPSQAASNSKTESKPITVLNPTLTPQNPASESETQPDLTPEPTQRPEPVRETPTVTPAPVLQETLAAADTATDESSEQAKELVEEAIGLRDAGKIIQARELLNDTLNEKLSPTLRSAVKFQLTRLADQWLFSSKVYPEDKLTGSYEVQKGDLLEQIAKKCTVPYEILMKINNISQPRLLRAGQRLKIIEGPFNVIVYKNSFTMDLYLQNKYIKTYKVGLGRVEHETPTGRWRVEKGGKLIKPTWTDPDTNKTYVGDDPDYPLGSRWIAIEGIDENTKQRTGFAIHGTKDPESIGVRSSRGCIRLFNGDVIEVYNLLYGGVSEVLIVD